VEYKELGRAGLKVSRLGVGLAKMGQLSLAEAGTAGRLLHAALDGGISFLDEELHRRFDRVVEQ